MLNIDSKIANVVIAPYVISELSCVSATVPDGDNSSVNQTYALIICPTSSLSSDVIIKLKAATLISELYVIFKKSISKKGSC